MGGDMVTALGRATVEGRTLFGHNCSRLADEPQALVRVPGRCFALGEKTRTQFLDLPQARQTWTVLGTQSRGLWGYQHGVNEHGVAAGCTASPTRLRCQQPGLLGPDLVRLALERAHSARQAVDLVADLISRHGQGCFPGCPVAEAHDNALLMADPREAFLIEAAGPYWVCQEIGQVRAVSDACTVRQDWDAIARGLAAHAIGNDWWPDDGSKLDFAGALVSEWVRNPTTLRRWGRATLLLEEQNGHIDHPFLRRLLGDHYEGCDDEVDPLAGKCEPLPLCQHGGMAGRGTAASFVADLGDGAGRLPLAWWSFGPPCTSLYFPVFPDGEVPPAFGATRGLGDTVWENGRRLMRHIGRDQRRWHLVRECLARLQARFDQDAEEFTAEAATMKQKGDRAGLERSGGLFLQHLLEQFEEAIDGLLGEKASRPGVAVSFR